MKTTIMIAVMATTLGACGQDMAPETFIPGSKAEEAQKLYPDHEITVDSYYENDQEHTYSFDVPRTSRELMLVVNQLEVGVQGKHYPGYYSRGFSMVFVDGDNRAVGTCDTSECDAAPGGGCLRREGLPFVVIKTKPFRKGTVRIRVFKQGEDADRYPSGTYSFTLINRDPPESCGILCSS